MSERRRNPLTGSWVIVSPGRASRPWQGDEEPPTSGVAKAWDPDCYLCARNRRTSGAVNPDYRGVYVFDNDFPALDASEAAATAGPLFAAEAVTGRCRVICYSPRHDVALAALDDDALRAVVDAWCEETAALGRQHAWVQIFENRGRMMGSSNDHPHGQIWASSHLPTLPALEDVHQADYAATHGRRMLLDYAAAEIRDGSRVVFYNAAWLAVVPYWAAWPFEILLLPRQPCGSFGELGPPQTLDLVDALGRILRAYDRLFGVPFPYSMGWHGRARGLGDHWQLHAHFYPPLLRSASVRKFMVGYEMLAEGQRDLTAEMAAARLRTLVDT